MEKRTSVFARVLGERRVAARLAMATAVVALTPLVLPERADAQYSVSADSDGYVPVYDVCFAGPEVGYYSWYNDGYTTSGEISIDSCLLDSLAASPADYDRVLAHEQGHAAGYGHSSDPSSIMYPYAYIYQGGEQYEEPEPEQYEAPEQYETPEDEQYDAAATQDVQQYEPGQEADEGDEAPDVREVPREELQPIRMGAGGEETRKEIEKKREDRERKKGAEQDEAVDRVREEAAALARAVDGADTLADEEPRDRAEALARTIEKSGEGGKEGPLAEARTGAEDMAASLSKLGEKEDEPARDRAQAISETRKKAEDLAGALDRAGDGADNEDRIRDLEEASADVRTVASKLDRAETEIQARETERRQAEQEALPSAPPAVPPAEARSTEAPDEEPGIFGRIKEFFASIFG